MYRYSIDRPTYTLQLGMLIVFSVLALFLAGCSSGTDVPQPSTPESGAVNDAQEIGRPEFAQVFFGKSADMQDCSAVSPVRRELDVDTTKPEQTADALLQSLLAGPTSEEKQQGYTSLFSGQTEDALRDAIIRGDTAYVNLKDIRQTIPNASSSCGSAQMLAEVNQTLRQIPGVSRVILAIDGNVKTFYDWIQMGCSADNDQCDASVFTKDRGTATGASSV